MAVSGKTAAPIEEPYFLDSDKPPNMATVTKAQADRRHVLLEALGMDDVLDGTAASGQLLIAQPGNLSRFKPMSGDVSINASGVTQIGNNKLATGMYQDASVTEGKIADAAATSRKVKPTSGLLQLSEKLTLAESYADAVGLKLEITPPVASILLVTVTASFFIKASTGVFANLLVDGVEQGDRVQLTPANANVPIQMGMQTYRIALTAAAHTIKVQGRMSSALGEGSMLTKSTSGGSNLAYMLFAS